MIYKLGNLRFGGTVISVVGGRYLIELPCGIYIWGEPV